MADKQRTNLAKQPEQTKSLTYVVALKKGYRVLTNEQQRLYNPNLVSTRKRIISA